LPKSISGGTACGSIVDADMTVSSNQPVLSCYPANLAQGITNTAPEPPIFYLRIPVAFPDRYGYISSNDLLYPKGDPL
jgi:hypothetical protein